MTPEELNIENPAISGVSPLSCSTMSCSKIDLLLSSRTDNVPWTHQKPINSSRHFGCISSHGKKLKDLTKLNNETGRVSCLGGKSKRKWHSSCFPNHYFLGSPGSLPLFNLRRRFSKRRKATTSNKISRRGLKTRSIMNQPLVLFCAKPLRLSNSMPSRMILHQSVFVGAKKSPTCNWGVSSRVTP